MPIANFNKHREVLLEATLISLYGISFRQATKLSSSKNLAFCAFAQNGGF